MPEAAERIRPVKKKPAAPPRRAAWARVAIALAPKSRRGFAGAALAAMMIGIVVNAVGLQHGKRIPLPPLPATAAVAPPAPKPSPVAAAPQTGPIETASADDAAPTPPARPAAIPVALTHSAKPGDGIGDFLRANGPENRRLISSAQSALIKLGYVVKTSGAMDADTRSALADFEKSHHLPVSSEVTAKLVKSLTAAAATN